MPTELLSAPIRQILYSSVRILNTIADTDSARATKIPRGSLDDEFRSLTLGCYKATSYPPSNFDLDRNIEIPSFFQRYMHKTVAAKAAADSKRGKKRWGSLGF